MKKMKRVTWLLFAIGLVLCLLPKPTTASAAAVTTESQMIRRFDELQQVYRHGEYWNWYNVYNGQVGTDAGSVWNTRWNESTGANDSGYFGSPAGTGTQKCPTWYCASYYNWCVPGTCNCVCGSFSGHQQAPGYAYKIYWHIWGTTDKSEHQNINSLYAGDVVFFGTHAIFVTKVDGNTVYFTECNSAGPCMVRWNQSISKSDITARGLVKIWHYGSNPGWDGVGCAHYNLQHVSAKSATCTATGNKEHWYCSGCGKYFSNSSATSETTKSAVTISKLGHSMSYYSAKGATCTSAGHSAYYYCSRCYNYYTDSQGNNKTTWSALQISKLGHKLTHYPAKAATCTTAGYKEQWRCPRCSGFFTDSAGNNQTTWSELEIPSLGHSMIHFAGLDATCTDVGCIEHYYCSRCSAFFTDSAGNNQTTWSEVEIPCLGHSMTHYDEKAATCTATGYKEHYHCSRCGKYFTTADGNSMVTWDWLTIPQLEHEYKHFFCIYCGEQEPGIIAWGYCGGEGDGKNLLWGLYDTGYLVIVGSGRMADYNYDETSSAPWFAYNDLVTELVIADGPTTVGDHAFSHMEGLNAVSIGDDVTEAGYFAFSYCPNLTEIKLGARFSSLGEYPMNYGNHSFYGCSSLRNIFVADTNTVFRDVDGVLYNKDLTTLVRYPLGRSADQYVVLANVTVIGEGAFSDCEKIGTVSFSNSVKTIETGAFDSSSITSISIPSSVTSIEEGAFYWCQNLLWADIPGSVKTIEDRTFESCVELTAVGLGDGVEVIGESAFGFCSKLSGIIIPDSVVTISDSAFAHCMLDMMTIGNGVVSVGSHAFFECDGIKRITLPESVSFIGDSAFRYIDNLSAVYFEGNAPEGVVAAEDNNHTFEANTVTLYYIPGTTGWTDSPVYNAAKHTWNGYKLAIWTERAPYRAWGYCGGEGDGTNVKWTLDWDGNLVLTGSGRMLDDFGWESSPWWPYRLLINTAAIEEGVTTLGSYAFSQLPNLLSVNISSTVTSINTSIAGDPVSCSENVREITVDDDNPAYCDKNGILFSKDMTTLIRCPQGIALTQYIIPTSVTTIGSGAFCLCNSMEAVAIPGNVLSIGNSAFNSCDSLTSVSMMDGILSIGDSAFFGCISLPAITIPDSVKTISGNAFGSCESLTSVKLPNELETIAHMTFIKCTSLKAITIPDSVKIIENRVFQNCGLETIEIPEGVTQIGLDSFSLCPALTVAKLPASVVDLDRGVFRDCPALTAVYFEGNAPSVVAADDYWPTFDKDVVTLYCKAGKTGWTDSSAYDAKAGTWNGYKLVAPNSITIEKNDGRIVVDVLAGVPAQGVFAIYQPNGKLVRCYMFDVPVGTMRWVPDMSADDSHSHTFKAFLLDAETWKPLCPAAEYPTT